MHLTGSGAYIFSPDRLRAGTSAGCRISLPTPPVGPGISAGTGSRTSGGAQSAGAALTEFQTGVVGLLPKVDLTPLDVVGETLHQYLCVPQRALVQL